MAKNGWLSGAFRGIAYRRFLARHCDVTQILSAIEHGNPLPAEKLLPLVYDELRRLAAALPDFIVSSEPRLRDAGCDTMATARWGDR